MKNGKSLLIHLEALSSKAWMIQWHLLAYTLVQSGVWLAWVSVRLCALFRHTITLISIAVLWYKPLDFNLIFEFPPWKEDQAMMFPLHRERLRLSNIKVRRRLQEKAFLQASKSWKNFLTHELCYFLLYSLSKFSKFIILSKCNASCFI